MTGDVMLIRTHYTIAMPEFWTSYLMNADDSYLRDDEVQEIEDDTKNIIILGVAEGAEPYFGEYKGVSCTMIEYVVMDRE